MRPQEAPPVGIGNDAFTGSTARLAGVYRAAELEALRADWD